jgi:hypothetical protein
LRLSSGCAAVAVALSVSFLLDESAFAAEASPEPAQDAGARSSAPTKKKKTKKKKKKRGKKAGAAHSTKSRPSHGADVATSMAFGYVEGQGVRKLSAPVVDVRARVDPFVRGSRFELRTPLAFRQRTPFGVSMQETRASAKLEGEYTSVPVLRVDGAVGAGFVLRPNWPDLYQPAADGELTPTDRFSYFARTFGLGATVGRVGTLRARLEYEYSLEDYRDDPNFEPVERPNHIPPGDRDEHRGRLSIRGGPRHLKIDGGALVEQRQYFFQFARDAKTGKTHAGPGGPPPNPLMRTIKVEPGVELRWLPLGKTLALEPAFAYSIVIDTFEGYYSSTAPKPSLDVEWHPTPIFRVDGRVEYERRRYGRDSYAAGSERPPLEYGDRRVDERLRMNISTGFHVAPSWELVLDVRGVRRRTNFPRYVPFEYPAGQAYDIDWNYDNASLLLGVRHEH